MKNQTKTEQAQWQLIKPNTVLKSRNYSTTLTRKKTFPLLILLITLSCLAPSCHTKGCTDINATNFDASADIDNGSCLYTSATFYASLGAFNGIPITKIDVTIDGQLFGSITVIYPNGVGVGNCGATGTVYYQFTSGKAVNWNTTVYLASGAIVHGTGQVTPYNTGCIQVNVTR